MSASPEDKAMAELETVEVLRRLGTREEAGITEAEAARRLRLHGPNVVVRSRHLRLLLSPQLACQLAIIIILLATTLISCFTAKLVLAYAKAPLEAKVHAPRAKVLRDGRWRDVHADNLVPGDIIFLKVGDIVPANARGMVGVQVLEQHARFFVALKLMFLTTYIDDGNAQDAVYLKMTLDVMFTDAVGGLIDLGLGVRVLSGLILIFMCPEKFAFYKRNIQLYTVSSTVHLVSSNHDELL
ncbi:hypothetical protein HU200_013802 [Digitaria exilis]|uniref:Cation-transporting P-type ATPase N-terminal domain-containing protein n=1 Tax=Digitaria exilis TaxID=1010633 RepID=A0A835KKS5_9POAL|nr:hypothetical protein HU200_013802 [Digitaria exilis]